jgi:lipid-A-disaccharide synthase-like uncharacterized protein
MKLKEYQKIVLGVLTIFGSLAVLSYVYMKTDSILLTCAGVAVLGVLFYNIVKGDGSHRRAGK